jgi:hypothetical protein
MKMTNSILDSVEPDGYTYGDDGYGEHGTPYYSRESVESIIEAVKAETRKEVLLEAAEELKAPGIFYATQCVSILRRMAEGKE